MINGVKQGRVFAPTLFSTMFSIKLSDAIWDSDAGICFKCRLDGKLFDLRRLQAISKEK